MKKPKFYQNWPDDNHCLQTAVMMALNTLDGPVSWEEVNAMTCYEDGLYSWTPSAVIALSKKIPGVKLAGAMNYGAFANRGEEYLKKYMNPQWFELQQLHAFPQFSKEQNIADIAGEAIRKKLIEERSLDRKDLEELFNNHFLIAVVDAGKLAGTGLLSGHFVLLYDQDQDNFKLHDSGLPPRESWIVSKEKFMKSFQNELIIIPWKG